jgi:glucosamine kinase
VTIFLGIDGGGSKTSCLIGNETSVLGRGEAGPSNVVRVGEQRAREALENAVHQACAAANVRPDQVERTCIGIAGGARAETAEVVSKILSKLVGGQIEIVGDMVIALQAAFGNGPGVIVIAGTGSIAYGRNARGESARAGGWGFAISDEGSAHWIGRTAVATALRAFDEGRGTMVLDVFMKAWEVDTRDQLVLRANASPPPDFAALFRQILSAAEDGDRVARDILTRAGRELAELGTVVIRRLFADAQTAPVAISGGVFRNSSLVREIFYNSLRCVHAGILFNANVIDPVNGALKLARARKNISC